MILWPGLAFAIVLGYSLYPSASPYIANAALSILCVLFGVRFFLIHGGTRITVAGVFNYAFALFIGFSGFYYSAIQPDTQLQYWFMPTLVISIVCQVLISIAFWRSWAEVSSVQWTSILDRKQRQAAAIAGTLALVLTAAAKVLLPSEGGAAALVVGIGMSLSTLLIAALVASDKAKALSWRSLAVFGIFSLYVALFHSGSGRLHIATLAFSIAIIYSIRFRSLWIKWALVLGTAPALWWASNDRVSYVSSTYGADPSEVNGLGSAVRPIWAFAKLLSLEHHGNLRFSYGSTLISPIGLLVPHYFWPSKPLAFGYALPQFTQPSKFGTGYSDAGSIFGEAFFNFSFLGFAILIPALGLLIRSLDRLVPAVLGRETRFGTLVALVAAIIISSGVSDLMWGGVHTYAARTLSRLIIMGPVFVIALLASRNNARV